MKKVIRLTESDLARIVKRVIREQESNQDQGQGPAQPPRRTFNLPDGTQMSVKLRVIENQDDLDTFLNWAEGRGPVTTLKNMYPKGLTGMPGYPVDDMPQEGSPEYRKWNRWNLLTQAIDFSLRSIARNGMTPTNGSYKTVVTIGMKPDMEQLVNSMGKTYFDVVTNIYNKQIEKLG